MTQVTYLEAIREALFDEMAGDDRVFCIGEDIGHFGGAFKVTAGLLERFGADRVVDTPIAESMIIGASIGAAIRGQRPVAEMQFADFVSVGFSQLINNAGTFHYRLGVSVPMVVRLPSGGGVGGGPFHSRNPEAWFAHGGGLKVVAPTTPEDAYGLMLTAIRDPDPVIYLEQKLLYRRLKAELTDRAPTPLGELRVVRPGRHITVVAYANGVPLAEAAAEEVSRDGLDVEVLDLRTLVPWDWAGVCRSVARTGRCLVVHEAGRTCGFGAEVAATLSDLAFEELDAPVRRITALDGPTPAHPDLEAVFRPDQARVAAALRSLAEY